MTNTLPRRLTTLQFSQIRRTLALTFIPSHLPILDQVDAVTFKGKALEQMSKFYLR